jgi:hypothetical protein
MHALATVIHRTDSEICFAVDAVEPNREPLALQDARAGFLDEPWTKYGARRTWIPNQKRANCSGSSPVRILAIDDTPAISSCGCRRS